jgi:hypothetical protein
MNFARLQKPLRLCKASQQGIPVRSCFQQLNKAGDNGGGIASCRHDPLDKNMVVRRWRRMHSPQKTTETQVLK